MDKELLAILLSKSDFNSDALLFQALTRDISDRITVTATNEAELGISADFFIESEKHKIDGNSHQVTWALSPATGGYTNFWVLGVSKLNQNTVLGY